MTRLSVNINKIATLRNARGGNVPDVIRVARDCEAFGADGITVHPRPDERHIRRTDVHALKDILTTEFNIEGYPSDDFLKMVLDVKPHQVTLVPDPPDVLTSNAGWNTLRDQELLKRVIGMLKDKDIRTSIFIDVEEVNMAHAPATGVDRVELYTGPFALHFDQSPEDAVRPYVKASHYARELGLGLNAGHDLSLKNLRFFKENVLDLKEVSIGHALISDALYFGLENTICMYRRELR